MTTPAKEIMTTQDAVLENLLLPSVPSATVLDKFDAAEYPKDNIEKVREELAAKLAASKEIGITQDAALENLLLPEPGTDMSRLSTEELTRYIGSVRALRIQQQMKALKHNPVVEQPRSAPAKIATRHTTSREWCKMAADGFTPLRRQPALELDQEYDTVISTPTKRTWTFRDQFKPTCPKGSDILEKWTVIYPCKNLEMVARDITRAWQLYSTSLAAEDYILLANTPLAVEVDNISVSRYSDLWMHLRNIRAALATSTKWRVVRRGGQQQIVSS